MRRGQWINSFGFLESEFDRAIGAREGAGDTVGVDAAARRAARKPLRERASGDSVSCSTRCLAAVYTTDAGRPPDLLQRRRRRNVGLSTDSRFHRMVRVRGSSIGPTARRWPMAIAQWLFRCARTARCAAWRRSANGRTARGYRLSLSDAAAMTRPARQVGAVNMLLDITERKRAEQRQHLMVARTASPREEHARHRAGDHGFDRTLGHHHRGISDRADRTHLGAVEDPRAAQRRQRPVLFGDIVHSELDAFDDGSEGRIQLNGLPVEINAQTAVSLGLAMHELTTNAAKYGALSVHDGKLDRDLERDHHRRQATTGFQLGGKRRTSSESTGAAGLRLAASEFRAAGADSGQGQRRLPSERRARAWHVPLPAKTAS